MREREEPQGITLDAGTVRQMVSLYKAITSAETSFNTGPNMYKQFMEHVTQAAAARNVRRAFEKAAEAAKIAL